MSFGESELAGRLTGDRLSGRMDSESVLFSFFLFVFRIGHGKEPTDRPAFRIGELGDGTSELRRFRISRIFRETLVYALYVRSYPSSNKERTHE